MNMLFEQVLAFHKKFVPEKIRHERGPMPISSDEIQFRVDFMHEELQEFEDALKAGDRAGQLDALVDLCWVAIGTAIMMFGERAFNWACDLVFSANIKKVRLPDSFKIAKPEGWKPPNISEIIADLDLGQNTVLEDTRTPDAVSQNPG